MKKILIFFVFLLGCVLTTEAQYTRLNKGQAMPYDGVAVELQTYRKESAYLKLTDSLLISYKRQISVHEAIIRANESIIDQQKQSMSLQSSLLKSQEQTAQQFSKGIQEIKDSLPKKYWFENPYLYGALGIIIGVMIAK